MSHYVSYLHLCFTLQEIFCLDIFKSNVFGFLFPHKPLSPRNKSGRKGFIQLTLFTSLFITKGSRDWISSRPGSRSWCRGHGGILFTGLPPLACSACFLIKPKTTSPRMAPTTMGWALPPWSLVEKMPYIWISWRQFLNWGSFLCDNSSLCQVDTKPARTPSMSLMKASFLP